MAAEFVFAPLFAPIPDPYWTPGGDVLLDVSISPTVPDSLAPFILTFKQYIGSAAWIHKIALYNKVGCRYLRSASAKVLTAATCHVGCRPGDPMHGVSRHPQCMLAVKEIHVIR